MKQGQAGRIAAMKLLAQRFAFASLVLASFALMLLGKADALLIERSRVLVIDALVPVLDVLSRPASAIAEAVSAVHDLAALRSENVRLREENARLMHWQTVARELDAQNRGLRGQLNYIPEPDPAFVSARVVADTGGAFVHSMLLKAGSGDGIAKGQAVVAGETLVGRVAEVGSRSARVLLVSDINSRIPVMLEASRARGILAGDNSERPKLKYLPANTLVSVGERVVTSGHGGAFPPGLPVGVVASVADGLIQIEPFVHRHRLEYVTVVEYGLAGILTSPPQGDGDREDR